VDRVDEAAPELDVAGEYLWPELVEVRVQDLVLAAAVRCTRRAIIRHARVTLDDDEPPRRPPT
jgi:hypothetical protein